MLSLQQTAATFATFMHILIENHALSYSPSAGHSVPHDADLHYTSTRAHCYHSRNDLMSSSSITARSSCTVGPPAKCTVEVSPCVSAGGPAVPFMERESAYH